MRTPSVHKHRNQDCVEINVICTGSLCHIIAKQFNVADDEFKSSKASKQDKTKQGRKQANTITDNKRNEESSLVESNQIEIGIQLAASNRVQY